MSWLVYSAKWFRQSLLDLPATLEVQQLLWAIVKRLEMSPTTLPYIDGTDIRLIKTQGHQPGTRIFPPLRVFFFIDGDRVVLLWAETYDEMDASSDEERLALLKFEH